MRRMTFPSKVKLILTVKLTLTLCGNFAIQKAPSTTTRCSQPRITWWGMFYLASHDNLCPGQLI